MAEFFSFLKMFLLCSTVFFVITLVLLALPQSRLRCVGLEMTKYAMVCGLVVLWLSPLDLIPTAVPLVGWLDDIGYILGACGALSSALGDRDKRLLYEEIELQELRAKANGTAPVDSDSQN